MPREEIVERLRRELIGPGIDGPNETIPERPSFRYLIGQLYPSGTDIRDRIQLDLNSPDADSCESDPIEYGIEEDDGHQDHDDPHSGEDDSDSTLRISHPFSPQSIGLTCNVKPDLEHVDVAVTFGTYAEVTTPGPTRPRIEWQRTPREHHHRITLPLVDSSMRDSIEFQGVSNSEPIAVIEWIIRRITAPDGVVSVSLSIFLINNTVLPLGDCDTNQAGSADDDQCLFQPVIQVFSADGSAPFVDRKPEQRLSSNDPDLERFKLLFRCFPEFAVGHGCAANWGNVSTDQLLASTVFTELLPEHELSPVVLEPEELTVVGTEFLEMERLAGLTTEELRRELMRLPQAYQRWISGREAELSSASFPVALSAKAREHLDTCHGCCERIVRGIELLLSDSEVLFAFRFMNQMMALQRQHVATTHSQREAETAQLLGQTISSVQAATTRWRPFQLAFILLNLRGIADPRDDERNLVDLLWFPTAGGKTEAYLGLTAFTLALRRLRAARRQEGPRGDGGVTVVMRYTLRLLTAQQFQRAAALICACELNRERAGLGEQPFLIGMWVGSALTPNRMSEAAEVLNGGRSLNGGDPRQLKRCPWCGTRLSSSDYVADVDTCHLSIRCSNGSCDFNQRDLPILLIDEEIYARCPSLLIGTVDKFARLPWQKRASSLFGIVDRFCPRHGYLVPGISDHSSSHHSLQRTSPFSSLPVAQVQTVPRFLPPELIIQDELHLISGPLGTMVGLYEAAVDYLCTATNTGEATSGRGPKIIASTATVRRANEQIRGLFARALREFPPPALSANDSFFARYVPPSKERSGRKYVGICAPGQSLATTQVRMSGVLLQQPWDDMNTGTPYDTLDPYLTLITFFNSLREVGAAMRRFQDDIPKFMANLCGRSPASNFVPRPPSREISELTSRKRAAEIPEILERLDLPHQAPGGLDTVLVTNMFSVGVDVDRLGLMAVIGQPKSTSEYIQATSRVGRRYPGLVAMMYNFARPRDLSHYERFHAYHQSLHRYVEPTGVTPFSPRARDRGLHAVYVSVARLLGFTRTVSWADSPSALLFDPSLMRGVEQFLQDRVAVVDETQNDAVRQEMQDIAQWWSELVHMVNSRNPVGTWNPSGNSGQPRSPSLRYEYHPRCATPIAWLLRHAGQRLLTIQPPPLPPNRNPDEEAKPTLDSLRDVEQNASLYRLM